MRKDQVNKVLSGEVTMADCMFEEDKIVNMLGDIVGNMSGQLSRFIDAKKDERLKLKEKLGDDPDDMLSKFDQSVEQIVSGREQILAGLRLVYDFLSLTRTWDNIDTRRRVKAFSEVLESKVFSNGRIPKEMFSEQQELFMEAYKQIQLINKGSAIYSQKQKVDI